MTNPRDPSPDQPPVAPPDTTVDDDVGALDSDGDGVEDEYEDDEVEEDEFDEPSDETLD